MNNKKALVTLTIGEHYATRWKKLCEENWRRYAHKNGYDIVCIDQPLDFSSRAIHRSPAWQKCLILNSDDVSRYHRVVWIDSDILLNSEAPCIVEKVPENKIGAVDAFEQFMARSSNAEPFSISNKAISALSWPFKDAEQYYQKANLPAAFSNVVQSGVMVLTPEKHNHILQYTYDNYSDTPIGDFEMEALSYEMMRNDEVYWLDYRFNRLWAACMTELYPHLMPSSNADIKLVRLWKRFVRGHYQLPPKRMTQACLLEAFSKSYFLHFAGCTHYMKWAAEEIASLDSSHTN